MNIIAVNHKNYKVPSDTVILIHCINEEIAIEYCKQYLKSHEVVNPTDLLPKDVENYKYHKRFEYTSKYGSYPMALELELINVITTFNPKIIL